jgi:acetyltransferase-like isoleucine patch superfamily enzyme
MTNQPPSDPPPDPADACRRLREFRLGKTDARVFTHPTCHPSEATGFCPCEGSFWKASWLYAKGVLLGLVFRLPFNGLKVWLLRRLGARVGKKVYFSAGVSIDPLFPELLTVEDNVFFGVGAKVFLHEFNVDEFRAGKVLVRRGALVGGLSVIRSGVEIGAGAVVAACAVVARDVPAGCVAISPPARILRRKPCPPCQAESDG